MQMKWQREDNLEYLQCGHFPQHSTNLQKIKWMENGQKGYGITQSTAVPQTFMGPFECIGRVIKKTIDKLWYFLCKALRQGRGIQNIKRNNSVRLMLMNVGNPRKWIATKSC